VLVSLAEDGERGDWLEGAGQIGDARTIQTSGRQGHLECRQHDEIERGEADCDHHKPRIDLADNAMEALYGLIGHRDDLGLAVGLPWLDKIFLREKTPELRNEVMAPEVV
jgi:hypothetical protein